MNKKTKLLLALLSAAAVSAGAFGLAACSGSSGKETNNSEYYAEYEEYLDQQKEAGNDYLGYQEWLTIKLFQTANGTAGTAGTNGTNGTNGADGATWLTGTSAPTASDGNDGDFFLNTATFEVYKKAEGAWTSIGSIKGTDGDDGVGVDEIAYDETTGQLIVKLSNDTYEYVELPSKVTHIHDYGANYVNIILRPSANNDGLGYVSCVKDGCEHKELTVVPRYTVTVVDIEGNPIEDVVVSINFDNGYTDADGKAVLYQYGYSLEDYFTALAESGSEIDDTALTPYAFYYNSYVVSAKKAGYAVAQTIRTGADGNITVKMISSFASVKDEYGYDVPAITGAGIYTITVNTQAASTDAWGNENPASVYTKQVFLSAAGGNKNYKITALNGAPMDVLDSSYYGSSLLDGGAYTKVLKEGQKQAIYFSADATALEADGFEFGNSYTYFFKVEELTLPDEGTEELPIDLTGTESSGVTTYNASDISGNNGDVVYYGFQNNSADTTITFTNLTNCTAAVALYGSDYYTTVESVTDAENNTTYKPVPLYNKGYFVIKITKGSGEGSASFSFTADVALGTLSNPYTITSGTAFSADNSDGTPVYAKFNVTTADDYAFVLSGAYEVTVYASEADVANYNSMADFYSFDAVHLNAGIYYLAISPSYDMSNGYDYGLTVRKLDAENDVGLSYLTAKDISSETFTDNVCSVTTVSALANEFTYYKYTASGAGTLTIAVQQEEGSSAYPVISFVNKTTGYLTNETTVTVQNGDIVYFAVKEDENSTSTTKSTCTVTVTKTTAQEVAPKTAGLDITVKNVSLQGVSGATVQLYTATYDRTLGTATYTAYGNSVATGENGVASFSDVPVGNYYYTVTFAGENPTYAEVSYTYVSVEEQEEGANNTASATVHAYQTFKITLKDADDEPLSDCTFTVSVYKTVNSTSTLVPLDGTFTTDENGEFTFKAVAGNYYVSYGTDGHCACKWVTVSETTGANNTETLTLAPYDGVATGSTLSLDMLPYYYDVTNTLVEGKNGVTNGEALGRYVFEATSSGFYTFTLGGDEKSYVNELAVYGLDGNTTPHILGGESQTASVWLGANRGVNRTYSVTVFLTAGEKAIIGYDTGTDEVTTGVINVDLFENMPVQDLTITEEQGVKTVDVSGVYGIGVLYVEDDDSGDPVTVSITGFSVRTDFLDCMYDIGESEVTGNEDGTYTLDQGKVYYIMPSHGDPDNSDQGSPDDGGGAADDNQ